MELPCFCIASTRMRESADLRHTFPNWPYCYTYVRSYGVERATPFSGGTGRGGERGEQRAALRKRNKRSFLGHDVDNDLGVGKTDSRVNIGQKRTFSQELHTWIKCKEIPSQV